MWSVEVFALEFVSHRAEFCQAVLALRLDEAVSVRWLLANLENKKNTNKVTVKC
jgi:hypothetical protein